MKCESMAMLIISRIQLKIIGWSDSYFIIKMKNSKVQNFDPLKFYQSSIVCQITSSTSAGSQVDFVRSSVFDRIVFPCV